MRIHLYIANWLKGREHIAILAIFGLLYLLLACANHYFFRTYAHDYGMYSHQLWDNAHFKYNLSYVANYYEGAYFLQLHLYILFFALTPFYWLLSWLTGTYTLMVVQELFVLFGAYGVFLLVRQYNGNRKVALFSLLFYFLFLGRWTAFSSDFNDYIYGTTLIPWFFLFNFRRQWIAAFLMMFLLWLIKENMPILTFFFSLFFMVKFWGSRTSRWANAAFMALSVGWFIFSFSVLVPWVNDGPGARQYVGFQYHALGEGPVQALETIITRPFYTLSLFFVNHAPDEAFDGIKAETYLVFLLSGGLLLFFRPLYLLLFLPIFAQKMLHTSCYNWSIYGHYIADISVLLPLALGMVLNDIKLSPKGQRILTGIILLCTLGVTIWKMHTERAMPWYTSAKECVYCPETYTAPFDASAVHHQLEKLPGDARISATSSVLPHLALREHIYFFPAVRDAEYIVILQTDSYPMTIEQLAAEIDSYKQDPGWELIVDDKPLFIFKKADQ